MLDRFTHIHCTSSQDHRVVTPTGDLRHRRVPQSLDGSEKRKQLENIPPDRILRRCCSRSFGAPAALPGNVGLGRAQAEEAARLRHQSHRVIAAARSPDLLPVLHQLWVTAESPVSG